MALYAVPLASAEARSGYKTQTAHLMQKVSNGLLLAVLLEIRNQHDVAVEVPTGESELLAVG